MPHKPPHTLGEHIALPRRLTADQIAQQSAEVNQLKSALGDAVHEAAELWDGDKFVGDPKKFQKFISWKPTPAKLKNHRLDKHSEDKSTEKYYDVPAIAKMWGFSVDLVRDIIKKWITDCKNKGIQSGVLSVRRPATRFKRAYTTVRVPEHTLQKIHESLGA